MANALTLPALSLILRSTKGAPLTAEEGDQNITALKNYTESLAKLFNVALNPDGTLQDNCVAESNIQERQIGGDKLKLKFLPFALDTGVANTYRIAFDPPLEAYEDGQVFWVAAANGNLGASTLNVNGLGDVAIKKSGATDLEEGDIAPLEVFCVVFRGGQFNLVGGARATAEPGAVTPSGTIDVQMALPDGAYAYGNNLFAFNRGVTSGDTHLSRIDLTTREVALVESDAVTPMQYMNVMPYRAGDGSDRLVWTSNQGVLWLPLQDPDPAAWAWTPYSAALKAAYDYKPVHIDETPGAGTPDIYAVKSGYASAGLTSALPCVKLNTGAGAQANYGTALNLHDAAIINGGAFTAYHAAGSRVLLFQHNPVKKRLYVMTVETGLVHVFKYDAADFKQWWDMDASAGGARYGALTYEKALALFGGAGSWGPTYDRQKYAVEFDLTTGEEKSVTLTRTDAEAVTGVVTRVPWAEAQ